MQALIDIYHYLMALTKEVPLFGGAITIWLVGTLTFIARGLPKKLKEVISNQLTVSVTLTNMGWCENEQTFHSFLNWAERRFIFKTRHLTLQYVWRIKVSDKDASFLSAGYGYHFFLFKGRLFWFKREKQDNAALDKVKESVTISGLTRNTNILYELVDEFRYKPRNDITYAYYWNSAQKQWEDPTPVLPRPLNTVVLPNGLMQKLIDEIEKFMKRRDWYISKGIPYKLVILLYGPTGTGKTTVARALSGFFKRNLYCLDLENIDGRGLTKALTSAGKGNLVLIEDFEQSAAVKKRQFYKDQELALVSNDEIDLPQGTSSKPPVNPITSKMEDGFSALTIAGFLNAIDGVVPLDDCIVIMTTNDISNLDPAVLRDGRVDVNEYVGYLDDASVHEYVRMMTGFYCPQHQFAEIPGCELYGLYRRNAESITDFIEAIPKVRTEDKRRSTPSLM